MEFITDLPSSQGHETILVVVDRLTKMASFNPCEGTKPDALYTARLVFDHIFRHHGLPSDITTAEDGLLRIERQWSIKKLRHVTHVRLIISRKFSKHD